MIARILMFMFIVMLAIPIGAFTPSGETGQAPSESAAKSKKHKNKEDKRKFTTVTRTVRQPVTRTLPAADPSRFRMEFLAPLRATPTATPQLSTSMDSPTG